VLGGPLRCRAVDALVAFGLVPPGPVGFERLGGLAVALRGADRLGSLALLPNRLCQPGLLTGLGQADPHLGVGLPVLDVPALVLPVLLDNTTTLSVWGGLKDTHSLEWLSTLAGHHDQVRAQHHNEGWWSGGSSRSSYGIETVPTLRPGDLRTLPRGRVLVLHRALRPFLARTVDVAQRADWKQLRADVDTVRAAHVAVDDQGFAQPDEAAALAWLLR